MQLVQSDPLILNQIVISLLKNYPVAAYNKIQSFCNDLQGSILGVLKHHI